MNRRQFIKSGVGISLISFLPKLEFFEKSPFNIKEVINKAKEGDIIYIPSGYYRNAVIDKDNLTVILDRDVIFYSDDERPALTVDGDNIEILQRKDWGITFL